MMDVWQSLLTLKNIFTTVQMNGRNFLNFLVRLTNIATFSTLCCAPKSAT